jgi:hypothetical protein
MEAITETLELIGNQKLVVERCPSNNVLKLISSEGRICLSISLTADGPVLRFDGPSLLLESTGDLAVDARRVAIHGREEVVITSGGDAAICVAGDLNTEARVQNISARLGNVNVKANDDVRLRGERIKLNC